MMPMSCAGFSTTRRHLAIRVADQNHLRVRVADGRNAAHQAVGGQHGQIFADAIAAAEVNLDGVPPIGGVAHDDVGELEFPRRLPLPAEQRAELVVFPRRGGGLRGLNAAAARFRGGGIPPGEAIRVAAGPASAAVTGSCWTVPARPNRGKNQLPTASFKRDESRAAAG